MRGSTLPWATGSEQSGSDASGWTAVVVPHFSNDAHSFDEWITDSDEGTVAVQSAMSAIPWLKTFIDNDTRYNRSLCQDLAGWNGNSGYQNAGRYEPAITPVRPARIFARTCEVTNGGTGTPATDRDSLGAYRPVPTPT
ncbi:hypothetical protein [Streptomyces sp. MP131-18]|uniref:hypothetical protein n=1 Tax=Streptomyces sp. MP131-18 TaxID=1857892 RepID=UPI00097C1403|nr:hypothetical protein [Streptomyces sp. MP131-18]ONK14769.1 hypothetical protein STBA_55610 [Streptomyces sp. MP131-18]